MFAYNKMVCLEHCVMIKIFNSLEHSVTLLSTENFKKKKQCEIQFEI